MAPPESAISSSVHLTILITLMLLLHLYRSLSNSEVLDTIDSLLGVIFVLLLLEADQIQTLE